MGKYDEDRITIACANWLKMEYDNMGDIFGFHVPNGGKRDKATAAVLKAMGVIAGVSDFIVLVRGLPPTVVFIEMKADDGYLRAPQKAFKGLVEGFGFPYHVIKTSNPYTAVGSMAAILKPYRRGGVK